MDDFRALGDQASERISAANKRYEAWRLPGSDGKKVDRVLDRTVLGIRTHVELGRRDTPPQYICKLISWTLWISSHLRVERKRAEIVMGRCVRQMCLHRPTFVCFEHAWTRLSQLEHTGPLPTFVRAKFLCAICLAPVMFSDL